MSTHARFRPHICPGALWGQFTAGCLYRVRFRTRRAARPGFPPSLGPQPVGKPQSLAPCARGSEACARRPPPRCEHPAVNWPQGQGRAMGAWGGRRGRCQQAQAARGPGSGSPGQLSEGRGNRGGSERPRCGKPSPARGKRRETDEAPEKVPLPGRQAAGRQGDKRLQTLTASFREPET